eukprot:m.62258 g.62258  ORF g.62258 m.62258 type:complete len:84 (+) comp13785_c0_seq1:272-523(+)
MSQLTTAFEIDPHLRYYHYDHYTSSRKMGKWGKPPPLCIVLRGETATPDNTNQATQQQEQEEEEQPAVKPSPVHPHTPARPDL